MQASRTLLFLLTLIGAGVAAGRAEISSNPDYASTVRSSNQTPTSRLPPWGPTTPLGGFEPCGTDPKDPKAYLCRLPSATVIVGIDGSFFWAPRGTNFNHRDKLILDPNGIKARRPQRNTQCALIPIRDNTQHAEPSLTALDELPGSVTLLLGNSPSSGRTYSQFKRVVCKNVFEGVDVEYSFDDGRIIRTVFSDPSVNRDAFRYKFIKRVGQETSSRIVRSLPDYWNRATHEGLPPARSFDTNKCTSGASDSKNVVPTPRSKQGVSGFSSLADSFSWLGGSGWDVATSVETDSAGNIYVAGYTESVDFPTTDGAFQEHFGDAETASFYFPTTHAFITKLDPTATRLIYSTYIGGTGTQGQQYAGDFAQGIAVDSVGCAYITGVTYSPDYPTTPGALRTTPAGPNWAAFITKLSADGSHLEYSTLLAGSRADFGNAIALDGNTLAVCGGTWSTDFPVTTNAFQPKKGTGAVVNAFVSVFKVSQTPSKLEFLYSTYIGGRDDSRDQATCIRIGADKTIYVGGVSKFSVGFPTTGNGFIRDSTGLDQGFVCRFDPSAAGNGSLMYSTLISTWYSTVNAIDVDRRGLVCAAGETWGDLPTTPDALDRSHARYYDGFAMVINPTASSGDSLVYSTYIGGGDSECTSTIIQDDGRVIVAGYTGPNDSPLIGQEVCSVPFVISFRPGERSLAFAAAAGGCGGSAWASLLVNGKLLIAGSGFGSPAGFGGLELPYHGDRVFRTQDGGTSLVASSSPPVDVVYSHPSVPQTVYGLDQNLYASSDGGHTWSKRNVPSAKTWSFDPFAVDAGGALFLSEGTKLHVSRDGGQTWSTNTSPEGGIQCIVSSPSMPGMLLVGNDTGVYLTRDAGVSWVGPRISQGADVTSLAFDPSSNNIWYAGVYNKGIWVSTDAGVSWRSLGLMGDILDRLLVIKTSNDAPAIYAGSRQHGMVASFDAGQNWKLLGPGGMIVSGIAVDPTNSNRILLTSRQNGLYKTENGGLAWTRINGSAMMSVVSTSKGAPTFLASALQRADAFVTRLLLPPLSPGALNASSPSASAIRLQWDDRSIVESNFEVERSTNGRQFQSVAKLPANAVGHTDSGIVPGRTYYYRVSALNDAGRSEYAALEVTIPKGRIAYPKRVNFGKGILGSVRTIALIVKNVSTRETLYVELDAPATPFSISGGEGFVLPARGSRSIEVSFTPERRGRVNGRLRITSSDPRKRRGTVTLTGSGI